MSLTITSSAQPTHRLSLGDIENGDYFTFFNSKSDVPNLYRVARDGESYRRIKTGKSFPIVQGDVLCGEGHSSLASDPVVKRDVTVDYK